MYPVDVPSHSDVGAEKKETYSYKAILINTQATFIALTVV